MTFKLDTDVNRHTIRLSLSGKLDSDAAHSLDEKIRILLAEHDFDSMVLDMSGLEYITSTGIRVIIKVKTYLSRQHKELIMLNMQPQVKKVFDIVHLLPVLNVFESTKELDVYLTKLQKKIINDDDEI